jgi:hypothetical protein
MIFKRPWMVFVLLVGVIVFTAGMLLRAWSAIRYWAFLSGLPLEVSPLYLALTGGLWALFGLRVIWWLWQGNRGAPAALRTLATGYVLYYWVEQLLVMTSPLRQARWPFSAVMSAAAVIVVMLILMHPSVKNFYGGSYEQKDQP